MQREMNPLDLALLGPPEVRRHEQLVSFATRKALALLLYLAVEGGRHPREKITDLFWPASDSEHGRAALRRTLVLLRRALPDADDYLLAERDRLGFNPESNFKLDLHVLAAAVHAGPTREALAQLQAAVEAYRGDFLAGFSLDDAAAFDDWASLQREYWHRQMESVFDWLSQLHAESGATGPAIDVAVRWVAHAPLNEAAHRRLMMCLFIAGNRTSALQAYEACRALLRDELDVEPEPETEALAERIRAEKVRIQHAKNSLAGNTATFSMFNSQFSMPLVGRATEFGRLVAAYHAAAQGHPHVVTLEGEAGIGKTRLALEFVGWARAQGAQALHGRAFEAGDRVPYQPLVEALRQANLQLSSLNLSPTWLAELTPLLPELREVLPEGRAATSGADAAARTRLLEAVARLTQAVAETAPLILFLDDAQWADAASFDVLRYAVRRWSARGTPALLLLALRTESLAASLVEWLASVEREAHTARYILNALTAEDTRQLVEAMTATSAAPDLRPFSRWLFMETGGQPFFMIETLKTLVERGVLVMHRAASGGWTIAFQSAGREADLHQVARLPHGVQSLIRTRLARLTPPALALLTAGAVLEREFHFETVCAVAGLREDEGLAALDELLSSYLLREGGNDSAPELLAVTHDKIRDVVYADAGQARRRVFHRRAFEALQMMTTPAGELAHHALAAGLTEPAFRFSLAAGDDALRVFAVRGAIRQYEQARALAASLQLPISHLQSLYLQLGRAYELESDFASARAVYEALLASARQADLPEVECAALNRLATLAAQASMDFESALAHLRDALSVAQQHGYTTGLAETEWNLAQIGYYMFDPRALPHGERALALARELGRPELLARSLNGLAWVKGDLTGDWPHTVVYAEEARTLYRSLGSRAMEADCLCLLANAHLYLGRPQAAIDSARAAQAISLEIDNPWGQAHSAFQLAKCALEVGAYAEALAQARQGAALAQARQMPMLSLLCLDLLGVAQRMLGMFDAARETHQAAAAQFAAAPALAPPLAPMISSELIADQAAAGDWQTACASAQQLKHATFDGAAPYTLVLSFGLLIETFLRAGEAEAVAAFIQGFGERMRNSQRAQVAYLRALALLDQWRGEIAQAIAHLLAAASLAEAIGLPGELWQIDTALGELYRQQDDESQAQVVLARACATVHALASRLGDEQLRKGFFAAEPIRRLLAEEW
jgi:DNA-binding SARP family transcriptional activator